MSSHKQKVLTGLFVATVIAVFCCIFGGLYFMQVETERKIAADKAMKQQADQQEAKQLIESATKDALEAAAKLKQAQKQLFDAQVMLIDLIGNEKSKSPSAEHKRDLLVARANADFAEAKMHQAKSEVLGTFGKVQKYRRVLGVDNDNDEYARTRAELDYYELERKQQEGGAICACIALLLVLLVLWLIARHSR